MKKMQFTAAMKDFFGFKEGQGLKDFHAEIKALSDDEKQWFRVNLEATGHYIIENPVKGAPNLKVAA
mgnify:CR=1 FL=1